MRRTTFSVSIVVLATASLGCSLIFKPDRSDLRPREDGDLDAPSDTLPDTTDDPSDVPVDTTDDTSADVPSDGTADGSELPCSTPTDWHVSFEPVTAVDILVVVDDSSGMSEEQALLPGIMDGLLECLTTDTCLGFDPGITSIHLGAVSTNMGSGMFDLTYCEEGGDGGVINTDPDPANGSCDVSYPPFLSWGTTDPWADLADAFECTSVLGTFGCGYEQPLEASHAALTTNTIAGGAHVGFLRDQSLLAVYYITDENDCSVSNDAIFDPSRTDLDPGNLRCFNAPEMLHDIDRYVTMFKTLRPNPHDLVVGVVSGVPTGVACEGLGSDIGSCLEQTEMVEEVSGTDPNRLEPSCDSAASTAYPARRMVELAQSLPFSSAVGSICNENLADAFYDANALLMGRIEQSRSPDVANPEYYKPAGDECSCMVECELAEYIWGGTGCPEGRSSGEIIDDGAGGFLLRCIIPQVGARLASCTDVCGDVTGFEPPLTDGWYFDATAATNNEKIVLNGITPDPAAWYALHCCW